MKHPEFDEEFADALAAIRSYDPITRETIPQVRAAYASGLPGVPPVDLTCGGSVLVADEVIPGHGDDPDLTVLVLRPSKGVDHPVPCLYYIHGGGMIIGDRRDGVDFLLPYVREGRAVIVSVEYRLAPEHPDPGPVNDCYAGLSWVHDNAPALGVDPDRLMVVGPSAGGGLAAGTALLARDLGHPSISHQILISPMLDDRMTTPSSRMLEREGAWDRNDNRLGWDCLLGHRRGGTDVSVYAAPARATDLTGLPRTFIDVGSVDTFRDEDLQFAQHLSEAGVNVDMHLWGGAFHGFTLSAPDAAISKAAQATRDEFIRRAIG